MNFLEGGRYWYFLKIILGLRVFVRRLWFSFVRLDFGVFLVGFWVVWGRFAVGVWFRKFFIFLVELEGFW